MWKGAATTEWCDKSVYMIERLFFLLQSHLNEQMQHEITNEQKCHSKKSYSLQNVHCFEIEIEIKIEFQW